jgi:hypothetical protein
MDVLQNFEAVIAAAYRAYRTILDLDVKDALDALARHYHAEEEGRTPPVLRLGDRARRIFTEVQGVCEWRLGRTSEPGDEDDAIEVLPVGELVACLRKLSKSVVFWSNRDGRQGYVQFIRDYV